MPAPNYNHDSFGRAAPGAARYILRLYVIGTTPSSCRAVVNLRRICDEHLATGYDLDVVDVARHPERAVDAQIVAAPTLLKRSPLPQRRLIGDLSDTNRVLAGLDLAPAAPAA